MARCECCRRNATMTCGFGGQSMLSFCDEHYVWHMAQAHQHEPAERELPDMPSDEEIRRRYRKLRSALMKGGAP